MSAPYYHNVASGPGGGSAIWVKADDGVRTRVGLWPEGTRGTVVMFPGRTEYVEKYSDAAREFHARGYASAAIDWRGQGLTERPKPNRMAGHVEAFADYQLDAAAMLAALDARDFPKPYHLLAHSMGGLIGLRLVMGEHPFASAGFSGPMWGLQMPPLKRIGAWVTSRLGRAAGIGTRTILASGKVADPAAAPFENNLLTGDAEMFAWMKRQFAAHPDLALGAPSYSWVWTALREMVEIADRPSPDLTALTVLGSREAIVAHDAIERRMEAWPKGTLMRIEGCRHEALIEVPAIRNRVFDALDEMFAGAG